MVYKVVYKYSEQPETNGWTRISHILPDPIGGYTGNYYSYALGNIQNAEIFQKFKEEGLTNTKLGLKYR